MTAPIDQAHEAQCRRIEALILERDTLSLALDRQAREIETLKARLADDVRTISQLHSSASTYLRRLRKLEAQLEYFYDRVNGRGMYLRDVRAGKY